MARIKFELEWPKPGNPWIFLLIGGVFLCVGTGFFIHSVLGIHGATLCEGTVIDIGPKISSTGDSTPDQAPSDESAKKDQATPGSSSVPPPQPKKRGRGSVPEVRYSVDGTNHTIFAILSTSPSAYAIGQKVPVYYFPEHPEAGVVGSFVELWLFPLIFGGIGAVLTFAGAFTVLWRWTNPVG